MTSSSLRKLGLAMLTVLLSALLIVPSAAGASDPPNVVEAHEKYHAGALAYSEGRYNDAIDLFLEADRLAPSAALSFDIARGYEKLKDSSGALRWYRDYLRRADHPSDEAEVQRIVRSLERRLLAKGVQQVTVSSSPRGAT